MRRLSLRLVVLVPSSSMMMQYGQVVARMAAPLPTASLTLISEKRSPFFQTPLWEGAPA